MTAYKGEIWLANLNPVKKSNEMGKIRPVVVFQNNTLNESDYPTTIVLPLSSELIDEAEPLRMRVTKREKLSKDSDIVITQIRAIDNTRLTQKVATLTSEELQKLKVLFDEIVE